MDGGDPFGGGRVPGGARQVTDGRGRLQADEPAQDGEGRQLVPGGQGDEFGTDGVPPQREPRAPEGLQEDAVEREGQQRGIAQAPRERLGPVRGLVPGPQRCPAQVAAAALDGDGGQQPCPQRGRTVGSQGP